MLQRMILGLKLLSRIQERSPQMQLFLRLPVPTSRGCVVTSPSMTTILLVVEPVVVPSQAYQAAERQRFDVA
jgi:hypothetical protein